MPWCTLENIRRASSLPIARANAFIGVSRLNRKGQVDCKRDKISTRALEACRSLRYDSLSETRPIYGNDERRSKHQRFRCIPRAEERPYGVSMSCVFEFVARCDCEEAGCYDL
jgi:hypothetical protein